MKTLKHLFTALLLMVAIVAMAHDFEVGGIYYNILSEEEKTVEVTYRGISHNSYSNEYTGSVDIPSSVISNGITYAVTRIEYYAFLNCTGLTSVTIPNSVTNIENKTFGGCTSLKELRIEDGGTILDLGYNSTKKGLFYDCPLETLYLGRDLSYDTSYSYGYSPFYNIKTLKSVTISNSVTNIENETFGGCTSLKELRIEDGGRILYLGYNSTNKGLFYDCPLETLYLGRYLSYDTSFDYGCSPFYNIETLKSVTIGNSVTSIGEHAFGRCSGLTSVTIPNSVTSIGSDAFSYSTGLKEVHISDIAAWCNIDFKTCYSNPLDYAHNLYLNGELVTDLVIPYGVSEIKSLAFGRCSGLTSVTIPNSVTSIGSGAFSYCSGLTSVTIPNSVTSIGSDAFYKCGNLKKAIWLTNTPPTGYKNVGTTINYVANDQYSGLSNVKVYPYLSSLFEVDGVKYVPVSPAERTCDAIDCVYDSTAVDINIEKTVLFKGIAMNVKQLMPYTFYANKNIKTIKVENDGIVGNYAFNGCTSLNSATISNNGSVGDYAFNGCTSLATAIISNNGSIGNNAFRNCSSLVTATLGDSIASIGASAFYGCPKLSEIVIPDAVTAIGSSAFRYCTSLETVKVGNGTKNIDSYAFSDCSALSSITLGDSVATIGSYAFAACSSLPEIVIPQSVTKINSYAFDGCTALADVIVEDRTTALSLGSNGSSPLFSSCPLDSVYIGGKITYSTSSSYGYSPFYRNTSLRSVVITDTEEEVYDNEFYGCSNLKNVSIGNGVKKIGNWAFSGCSALDYFAFGKSVQSIGEEAFSDCNNVTQIISRAKTPPTCGAQALDDINKWNCTLWVPENYKAEYQSAEQWKEFFFVEGIAAQTYTVTFIVDGEVYDTLSVEYGEKITLPETPVKEGHTFSGWSDVPETMPAEDITITGSFEVNTYAVTYIVDGEVYATDSVAYGSEIVLRDEPAKEGHTFSGWSEAPATMPAEDITITGSFEVNTYAVTYIVDGEVYATDSIAYGSEIVLRDGPVKEGHTFSGWSEVPETMPAEDITITGSFEVNTYAVTYIVDGEVYATDSVAYGSEIVLRDEPAKEGHTFSGWGDVPETMPAEDITVEGTFSINSYTVTFIIDGEVYETATVEFGAKIELPTPPEKEGYIFSGWVGVPDTMPAEDIVIEGEYIVDTTGINDLKAENGNVRTVYDLQGRKVDNPTNGIYIVNGKKVFIK